MNSDILAQPLNEDQRTQDSISTKPSIRIHNPKLSSFRWNANATEFFYQPSIISMERS